GNLNNGREPYTDLQYAKLARIGAHYIRHGLTLADFTSHELVARPKGRKNDPLAFDWARFRRETSAILAPRVTPPTGPVMGSPMRVWSGHLEEHLIVVRVVSDTEWYYLPESAIASRAQRAATP